MKGDYLNKKIDNKKLKLKKRKKEQFHTNALKKDTFNGRRYLGTSKFGKDIWIIMRFNKEDMQISLEIDGKLDDLRDPDAILAPVRISQRLNRPKPNINDYIRLNRKNAGGQVTLRTIQYIEKLIRAVKIIRLGLIAYKEKYTQVIVYMFVTIVVTHARFARL